MTVFDKTTVWLHNTATHYLVAALFSVACFLILPLISSYSIKTIFPNSNQIFASNQPVCSNLDIVVSENKVTLTARGCTVDGSYSLIITNTATQEEVYANQIIVSGSVSTPIITQALEAGQYEAMIRTSNAVVVTGTFEIQYQSSPALIQCGDAVPPNFPNCPQSCPSRSCSINWYCLAASSTCPPEPTIPPAVWHICDQLQASSKSRTNCLSCFQSSGIWTAVGCIPVEPESMIKTLIRIGLLVGGGVSFIIILAGSFILSTSKGEPKKITEAKEMITSALIGLVFIIFSVSILQLIGVQILHIPDFGI